jgi:glucose/arabinose dehydrogenase
MSTTSLRSIRLPLLAALWLVSTPARAEQPPNQLSEAERRAGWKLLFDGDSAGTFRNFRREELGDGWQVRDGALVRAANGAGDIITRDQFGAFELQLEYRISPGGNSGIMFHVTEEEETPWRTGPEVQVLDNAAGKDPQKAGWLYQLYAPVVPGWMRKMEEQAGRSLPEHLDATRPAGEWNHVYLRVAPGGGEVAVNGVVYARFTKGSKEWDERVAKSKFAAFPRFGKADQGHLCLQDHGDEVAYRSIKVRELPTDGSPIPFADGTAAVTAVPAFPEATWEGWSAESADGTPVTPLRPLVVTHAGDGSGRRFVLDQSGMIHVFAPGSTEGKLFLDLRAGTAPWGKHNEEGLLGLAFHPNYKANGQFFVTYSLAGENRVEHLARFTVSPDDPDRADPASEELVLAVEQPFWNHNGGSIVFGPDGCLYWGLGDGGSRDDPFANGQKLDTLLGKILRIDVDRRDEGRAYAIPADNPFVAQPDARGEIFAFGFRNPWQLAFDGATGKLWTADVGQDLWEEVDVVAKGGNYGWSLREGTRPFGSRSAAAADLIDPVWEYDHQIGKSITGGIVYRGRAIPELVGAYLYGDFVSGRLWALTLDETTGQATNLEIPWSGMPIFGFGTDADGEAYVLTSSPTGQGVFRLAPAPKAAAR